MASKDITKTGALTYKDLQQENNQNVLTPERFQQIMKDNNLVGSRQMADYVLAKNAEVTDREVQSPLYEGTRGRDYFGKSMFDNDIVVGDEDWQHLSDVRAENQPWYAKLGAGVGKGVALAATTFLDGTVGLIAGLTEMPDKGISALWDNEVSNALADTNRALEEILPNYRTEAEQENAWYENLGTMNFWADGVIKNLGFTVGAFYSGSIWTKALEGLGLLKGAMGAKVIGSFTSALNEGRIEANNTVHDITAYYDEQINDARDRRKAEILNSGLSDVEKQLALKELAENTVKLREEVQDRADAVGLTTLIGNTVLLSLDNFIQFGKLYARGFKNARGLASGITKAAEEEAIEEAGKNVIKQGNKYAWKDITKKEAIMKGLRNGLLEGNEEMAQAFIAETAGNMQEYDSPNAYYQALIDPQAQKKTKDFVKSVTEGFVNTYGNGDRWEEFAIGAFTGLFGMPTFGRVNNADANTYLGRGKAVGLSKGLFGEIGNANQQNREGREAVDAMNKYMDKLQSRTKYFVQSQSFTDAMDGWAEANNAFEYKNAEDNDDFVAISRFAQTGKLNDLKEMVNQDFEDELADIAMFTSPNLNVGEDESIITTNDDGSPIEGGWRNTDGSLMSDSEEGREQMKKELIAKRDKILSEIDKYEKSVATVRAIGNNSLTEDQVNELAWLNWKVGMFTDRYNSIKNENQEFLAEMQRGLQAFQNGRGTNIIDEESEEGQKLIKAMNNALEFVNTLEKTNSPLQLSAYLEANPHMTEFLEEFAYPIIEDMIGVDAATFEKSMNDLKDVVKIAKATKTFNERYKEFRDNPVELINNRAKIDKKKEKVKKATEAINTKDKINNADVSDIVKEMKGGEVNADELDGLFSDEDSEFMQNIGANPEEMSGKQKVDEAKKIIQTKDQADKAIDALAGDPTMDAQALADAHTLLDASMDVANSEQEMLDTARQAFNDPTILYDDSLAGLTQDELASALNDRVQAAKSVIERVKGSLQDAQAELDKLPKKPVLEDIGLNPPAPKDTGHDAVNKTITENERQKLAQEKEAQKKAAEERKQKLDSFFSKHKEGLSDEDKAKFDKALADVLQGIDLLTQVDATDREIRSGMQDTLSYDILKQLAPTIDADLDVYITSKRKPAETPKIEPKSGEQNLPTPPMSTNDILNYTTRQENQDPNKGELDGSYKYWKPTITYLPIHNPTGNLVPFYKLARGMKYPNGASMFSEQQLNRIEKVGKYLEEHGAFALVDRGEVKTGSNVHFSIDKSLSDSVGELVILMTDDQGRVIGDVMSPNDPTFGRQAGLATLVRNIQSEYEEAGSPDIFTSAKYITKVDKNMIGKVPYQANHDTMNSLNAVHTNGNERIPFTLGIAVTSGSNARILATAGRTKKQGASKIEQTINPPLEAKAGQPFLLFPTSSEKNHFIPVPFLMDTYREGTKNTALGRAIRSVLDKIPQSSDREVMSIINGLEELLSVKEVHINYSDDNVKVTIKPHGEEHQRTIYNGSKSDPTAVDQIEYGLQVQSLPFQISRKYINEDYFGQDYNRMIGEIAMINLPVGQTHTVSDWFTVKPLDANGTITKAKSPRSTGQNPNAANVPTVTIPYKGMELSVDTKTWEVSGGTRTYTGERADLVKAHAFGIFTNKDMTKPYNTEWGYYDPKTNKFIEKPNRVLKTLGEPQQNTSQVINVPTMLGGTREETVEEVSYSQLKTGDIVWYSGPESARPIDYIKVEGVDKGDVYGLSNNKSIILPNNRTYYRVLHKSSQADVSKAKTTTQTSFVDTKTKESTSPSKKELNKNEPSTIEERIIIRTSNNGEHQAFGFDPNKGGDKNNTRAMEFWRTRVDTRDLRNPETGNKVQADIANVYIPLKDGTSVITYFHDKEGRAFGRRDGTGINVWRHLTPEEVKEIQEGLLNNEFRTTEEMAKFVDNILHKESTSAESKTPFTQEMAQEETPAQLEDKAKKAGLLGNKVRQAAWKVLTPEQQSTIVNKKGPKQKQWMEMLENAFNPATNTFDEVKLKGTVDELLGRKGMYRREDGTPETWNEEKEMAWMKQVLPNLSDEEHLKIVRGVSRLATEDGGFAYGKFQNGVITLAGNTARGTLYHEAFHAVAHTLLSADELDTLLEEAKKKWGNLNDVALEENLAEDFRKYVQLEETPILGTVVKIYRTLKHLVQNLIGNEPYINKLFYDINRGNMAESIPQATEATRYQMAEGFKGTVSEFQEIIDSYVNNPAVVHKLIDRNKLWGRLTDGWLKEGYIVKGYYDKKTGKWTVASAKKSDITNNTPSYYRKVEQYHRDKLMYNNLSQEDKNYLQERGISTDEYSKMTQLEKEVLFNCKY